MRGGAGRRVDLEDVALVVAAGRPDAQARRARRWTGGSRCRGAACRCPGRSRSSCCRSGRGSTVSNRASTVPAVPSSAKPVLNSRRSSSPSTTVARALARFRPSDEADMISRRVRRDTRSPRIRILPGDVNETRPSEGARNTLPALPRETPDGDNPLLTDRRRCPRAPASVPRQVFRPAPGGNGMCGCAKNGNASRIGSSLSSTASPWNTRLFTSVTIVSITSSFGRRPLGNAASAFLPPSVPVFGIDVFRRR